MKIRVDFGVFLVGLLLLASTVSAKTTQPVNLISGKTAKVAVTESMDLVSLRWEISSPDHSSSPNARVLHRSGTLLCKIQKKTLIQKGSTQLWDIQVQVQGKSKHGSSQSRCLVQVSHANVQPAFVFITRTSDSEFDQSHVQYEDTPDEGRGYCETYECDDSGRTSGSGPDDVDDGSRPPEGGQFDGGGYSNSGP